MADGFGAFEPGLPRLPRAVGERPVDAAHDVADPRARLVGGRPGLLVPRHRPQERHALLLPARRRGRLVEDDVARPGLGRASRGLRRAHEAAAPAIGSGASTRRRPRPRRCPDWVLAAYGSSVGSDRVYGVARAARATAIPRRSRSASSSRDSRSATLELQTGGFYALARACGHGARLRPRLRLPAGREGRGAADPPRARRRRRRPPRPARRRARARARELQGPRALGARQGRDAGGHATEPCAPRGATRLAPRGSSRRASS